MFIIILNIIVILNIAACIGWFFIIHFCSKISLEDLRLTLTAKYLLTQMFGLENQAIAYFHSGQVMILKLLYLDGIRRLDLAYVNSLSKSAFQEPTKVLVQDEKIRLKNTVKSHN